MNSLHYGSDILNFTELCIIFKVCLENMMFPSFNVNVIVILPNIEIYENTQQNKIIKTGTTMTFVKAAR